MGLESAVGLTTVLIGKADLEDAIQPWGGGSLHILPSGEIPPNPSEMLGSQPMAKLLEQLASQYDIVLIDTPPLLPVTDAAILAKITGGALVVAGADRLNRQQLADGLGALEDVDARVLGIVLNRLAHKQHDSYSYYDYAAKSTPASKRTRSSRAEESNAKQTRAKRAGRAGKRRSSSVPDMSETVEIQRQSVPASSSFKDRADARNV
jgi:Mrp family chromosome partitioning ATPase